MDDILGMTRDLITAQIQQRNIAADTLGDWLSAYPKLILYLFPKP